MSHFVQSITPARSLDLFLAVVNAEHAGEDDPELKPPDDMLHRANLGLLYQVPAHGALRVTCSYGTYDVARAVDEEGYSYVICRRVEKDVHPTQQLPPLCA